MGQQIVVYNVKITTYKQQQENADIHLIWNINSAGGETVIQQRPLHQKLIFSSDTTAHSAQSHWALRNTGTQLCFPPVCKPIWVSPSLQCPQFASGLAVFRYNISSRMWLTKLTSQTPRFGQTVNTETTSHPLQYPEWGLDSVSRKSEAKRLQHKCLPSCW